MPAVYLEPRAKGMPGIRDDAGLALLTDRVAPRSTKKSLALVHQDPGAGEGAGMSLSEVTSLLRRPCRAVARARALRHSS